MIFFDYNKIYTISRGRPDLIIRYFKLLVNSPHVATELVGNSFIINEDTILRNPQGVAKQQLAEYLGILSIRSYHQYSATGDTGLDLQLIYPWIPAAIIEENPLIQKSATKLIFQEEN